MDQRKFYEKKEYYIPIAIAVGIVVVGLLKTISG
ncbi:hypothetical protein SAMN05421765_1782 [Kaistella antarctica]|uniref:Uncharacterized protein n=1 Tax=Kaistella antarctica TaxID=266748 RepID=A0A3S4UY04_9FLAO|nr:hypothetical protein SAMN05421765_1782 [Kaistella antarctica]VEH98895.1 Uncharacterised protein [Kaistella antarctica]